jgi:hypothetical protein
MNRYARNLLAVVLTTGVVTIAAPGAAQASPVTYVEFKVVSSQPGVTQGPEQELLRVEPLGQAQGPKVSLSQSISSTWTVSDTTALEATLNWAVGESQHSGALASVGVGDDVKVDAEARQDVSGNFGVSGKTSVQRTTTSAASTTWTFQVGGPETAVRRGYVVYGRSVGTVHTLQRRRCFAVPAGGTGNDLCLGWVDSGTIFQPTGIGLRIQGLGWSSTYFGAKLAPLGQPQPVWISHSDPKQIGQPICPTAVGLNLDATTNTYNFGCAYTSITWSGRFTVSNLKVNAVLDPDSFDADLEGDATGTVHVERAAYQPGNSYRPVTMNSALITVPGKGTFAIQNWR